MRGNFREKNVVQVKNIEIQNGRAAVELTLPDCSVGEEKEFYSIYLWDEKGMPVFHTIRSVKEEEPCIIHLLHPHLWEGAAKPYLYCLEVSVGCYGEKKDSKEVSAVLLDRQWLALYTLQEIAGKGWFLNGRTFVPKPVQYESIGESVNKDEPAFWSALEQKLQRLVRMGANMLVLRQRKGMSEEEYFLLQRYCNRQGLILQTEEHHLWDIDVAVCEGGTLFHQNGLPTDTYYQYMARWSKEPMVYINASSFTKQADGGYRITVYSNRKKVVLLVNGVVFSFGEEGPEFIFQDMQIKSFPVCLTAEAEECGMSVVCYR